MLTKNLTLITFVCFTQMFIAQKTLSIKLFEICKTIHSPVADSSVIIKSSYSKVFDFEKCQMVGSENIDTVNSNYYKIYFNSDDEIQMIQYFERNKLLFKLVKLKTEQKLPIFQLYRNSFRKDQQMKRTGFLIYTGAFCYVINYSEYRPKDTLAGLNTLMFVDKNLHVVSYCRFIEKRNVYVAEVHYAKDKIKSASLYNPMNCSKINNDSKVTDFIKFKSSESKIYKNAVYIANVRLRMDNEYLKYPLWFWDAEHEFE